MKSHIVSGITGFLASLFVVAAADQESSRSLDINLEKPGDALVIKLKGKPVGGLRVDDQGRLGIFGANYTSTAVTIDDRDRIQIDPNPVASPPTRLTIADDVWLTGVLRVGRANAFGDAPFDPNGAIQVGRKLQTAQPMALFRAYAQGNESFRLGVSKDGHGYWSDGPHDTPMLLFQRSQDGMNESGKLVLFQSELQSKDGELVIRNKKSGKSSTIKTQRE